MEGNGYDASLSLKAEMDYFENKLSAWTITCVPLICIIKSRAQNSLAPAL